MKVLTLFAHPGSGSLCHAVLERTMRSTRRFNKTMNLGHRLSHWFPREFGSTPCRALTPCDFSTATEWRSTLEAAQLSDDPRRPGELPWKSIA